MDNVDAARDDLIARGVNVSEVFHYAGGPFNNAIENPRVAGRDPEGRSYFSFARQAQLVGLVCVLPKCASERQQSDGRSRGRQPLHGRSASRSSPMSR